MVNIIIAIVGNQAILPANKQANGLLKSSDGEKGLNSKCAYLYGPMCVPGEAKFTPQKTGVDRNL